MKTALSQALGLLPENSLVGLITYGAQVQVHELGFQECPKSYVFRGAKEYTAVQIQDQLQFPRGGLGRPGAPGAGPQAAQQAQQQGIGRFMLPLSECEFQVRVFFSCGFPGFGSIFSRVQRPPPHPWPSPHRPGGGRGETPPRRPFPDPISRPHPPARPPTQLNSVLEDLQRDPFQPLPEQRQARCTGSALSVAAGMLQAGLSGQPAHIVLFVGGPTTEGVGQVVAKELAEPVRSHKDIKKDGAPFYKKAKKFYEARD